METAAHNDGQGDVQIGESKRDRVRRLLIAPLQADGFRFRKNVAVEKVQGKLDQLADDLGYLSDAALADLRVSLRTKGAGADKCFWPERVTVLALAQARQPRPLEELPGILSWFASAAGREALLVDRLVAEYQFWTRSTRPPLNDGEWRGVEAKAAEMRSRLDLLEDRERRGVLRDEADGRWLDGYRKRRAYVAGLVQGAGKGAA